MVLHCEPHGSRLSLRSDRGPARAPADDRLLDGKRTLLPSAFLIGANALFEGTGLLTRGGRRYRQAFPRLRLVLPGGPSP